MSPTLALPLLLASFQQMGVEQPFPLCPPTVRDAVTGECLEASTEPALGRLYPLSADFYVSPSLGFVGLGTTSPLWRLHVKGNANFQESTGFNAVSASTSADYADTVWAFSSGLGAVATRGNSDGDSSLGVYGEATGIGSIGVAGGARDSTGTGVYGFHDGAGAGTGVEGTVWSPVGSGGLTTDRGVFGWIEQGKGTGVWGEGNAGETSDGVYGLGRTSSSYGVYGNSSGAGKGVVGRSPGGTAIEAQGDLTVTGVKNFAHPHPSDPAREIRFVCLEGNESGTYFRGAGQLAGGHAVIAVPEEFRLVSAPDGMTVQLTAVGARADLWVESFDLHQVVVRGEGDADFHYLVNGVRAGYEDYRAVRENRTFVPRVAGEPYGEHLSPLALETLVQSGVLNPDHTPNRATADRLGWTLIEPEPPRVPGSRASGPRPPALGR